MGFSYLFLWYGLQYCYAELVSSIYVAAVVGRLASLVYLFIDLLVGSLIDKLMMQAVLK